MDRDSSFKHLRQWEWGLPDAVVAAARAIWKRIGKPAEQFHVIEAGTVELFRRIPCLWEEYLTVNSVEIRGVTLNAYWVTHPGYERFASLIPIHFYRFSGLQGVVEEYLEKYGSTDKEEGRMCAFLNDVGSECDCADVQKMIQGKGLQDIFWFSQGFDCPDAECRNVFGELIPKPFEKVGEWMTSAPYGSHAWRPLDVQSVMRIMHGENA